MPPKRIRSKKNKEEEPELQKTTETTEDIVKPLTLTRILFYIDNKHLNKYNENFNNQLINKYSVISKCHITHPQKEKSGISLSLKHFINEETFNNIVNTLIKYFNDKSIIFKYRAGNETEDFKYTYSNIEHIEEKTDVFILKK